MPAAADAPPPPPVTRRDYGIGALIGLGAFVLYLVTLCPTIFVEDSAEFSTAAAIFGVPHPPGYPLYTLLAGLFVRVVRVGDVAYRSNLFSAACGGAAVAMLWVLVRRIGVGRLGALVATLTFAVGETFWSESLAAEVHSLNVVLLVLALLFTLEALQAPSARRYAWAGMAIGLAAGHRNINAVFLAPLLVVLELERRKKKRDPRLLVVGLAALAASAAVYLYLPIAASRDPALNMGEPTSVQRVWSVITAHAYMRHLQTASLATDLGRLGQFIGDLPANLGLALFAAPVGFFLLHRRGPRWLLLSLAWLAAASLGFSVIYNVLHISSYWIPTYLALSIAAGVGFDAWRGRSAVVLPIVAAATVLLNFSSINLHATTIAHSYGRQLLENAPPRALIVSLSDTETHVLLYEQAVEHVRPDAVVVSANELDGWYVEQLARRHPDVSWPTPSATLDWLSQLVARNQKDHPVCSTQPLHIGPPGSPLLPSGLLHCVTTKIEPADLQRSVAFWKTAVLPSAAEIHHADIHVRTIDFSFALARFALAAALAESGNGAEAQTQLTAVLQLDPDPTERAIARYMTTVGRERNGNLDLGRRAEEALRLGPNDPKLVELLRL